MVDIRIEGRVLDVFEGLDFSFNYSIADIRDPNKRSTEYSKTIKCPSTPNNDNLFGQIYDVNISNEFNPNGTNIEVNFNPNKKASSVVLADGVQVMRGVLQLRQITVNQSKMIYEVVFIGKLIDIFSLLGDKQLNGLNDDGTPYIDFSDLDHNYDYGRITSSWTNTTGYVYPMIDYGNYQPFFDSNGNRIWRTEMWRPAVFLKDIVDRVFSFVGFTYDSNFFSSAPFNRLIVPFNNEGFTLTEVDILGREASASVQTAIQVNTEFNPDYPSFLGSFISDWRIQFDQLSDPFNHWSNTNSEYTVPEDGYYSFNSVMTVFTERISITFPVLSPNPITVANTFVSIKRFNSITSSVETLSNTLMNIKGSGTPVIGETFTETFGFTAPSMYLREGDIVWMEMSSTSAQTTGFDEFEVDITSGLFEAQVSDTSIIEGQNVPMNSLVPEVGMAEMLLSVFKMFNLYVTVDPDNDRKLFIETWGEFYGGGQNKDWTYKLARDKDVNIQPLAMLTDKIYTYTYSEDGDYYNERYDKKYDRTYGDITLEIDNDFIKSSNEIDIVFSASPLANDASSNRLIPKIYQETDQGNEETEHNIRVLYYAGLLPSSPDWVFQYFQQGQGIVRVNQDQYPYAGHWDNPITPTLDINFGLPRELFYSANAYTGTLSVTNAGLFNVYHRNYFEEITNKDSKMFTGYFYLDSVDINQLDFRDQIIVDNSYWRINKVMNYNPFKDGLTKVELIKVIDITPLETEAVNVGTVGTITNGFEKVRLPALNKAKSGRNTGDVFVGNVYGFGNNIAPSVSSYYVQGNNNTIGEGATNIAIQGNDNFVQSGLHNVSLINTNGATVLTSNTTYVNGAQQSGGQIIDGGLNEVRALTASTNIFIVDGGLNMVSNKFSETGINLIEGGEN